MRSNYLLPVALAMVALIVIGVIVFLPSSVQNPPETPNNGIALKETPTELLNPDSQIGDTTDQNDVGKDSSNDEIAISEIDTHHSPDGENQEKPTPDPDQLAKQNNQQDIVPAPNAINGFVKDTRDIPLNGALVGIKEGKSTSSDAQGRFSLTEIITPAVTLIVTLAGYQTLIEENVTVGQTNLILTMVKEGSLAGRVLDQFNAPVSFAKIGLKALKGIWVSDLTTDVQGRFEALAAPEVSILITAVQEGYIDEGGGTVTVEPPTNKEIVLRLKQPTYYIAGNVVMKDSGAGVSGFNLRAVRQDSGSQADEYQTVTVGNGSYRFPSVRRGTYLVSSMPTENSELNVVIPVLDDFKTVRIFESSANNVNFEAVSGMIVSGVVLNSQNQPVSSANVTVAGFESTKTFTGSDGRFRLSGVPMLSAEGTASTQSASIRLIASHSQEGTGMSDPLPMDSAADLDNVTIVLQGIGTLSGSVADRSGMAIADARIVLRDLIQGQTQETVTDGAGGFAFENITSTAKPAVQFQGTHQLEASKEGYASKQQRIVFSPGEPQSVRITLDRGGTIQGRIHDSNGQLMGDVTVTAILPQGGVVTTVSDPTGSYELAGLSDGVYDLLFHLDTNPPMNGALYRIPVGTTNADVELISGEWLAMGTVIDKNTQQLIHHYTMSIEGTPLARRGTPFLTYQSVNTHDGTFQLTFTEMGEYRVRFSAPGYESLDLKVNCTLQTDRVQYINPELVSTDTTGGIKGVFVPNQGMVLEGINVLGVGSYLFAGNEFTIEGIPPGPYDLVFIIQVVDEPGVVGEKAGTMSVQVQPNQIADLGQITPVKIIVKFRDF